MDLETEGRFDRATDALSEMVRDIRELTQSNFPNDIRWSIRDAFISAATLGDNPPVRRTSDLEGRYYYTLDDDLAVSIAVGLEKSEVLYEVFQTICISNISARQPLPEPFVSTVALMISGRVFRPRRKRGGKQSQEILPLLFIRAAMYARDAFGLDLTRSDGSEAHSACDAVVMVLDSFDYNLKYSRLRDWCTKSDYDELRQSADEFIGILDTRYLHQLGALKSWRPFASILELMRTRS